MLRTGNRTTQIDNEYLRFGESVNKKYLILLRCDLPLEIRWELKQRREVQWQFYSRWNHEGRL